MEIQIAIGFVVCTAGILCYTIVYSDYRNSAANNTHYLRKYTKNPDNTCKVGEVICKGDLDKRNAAFVYILKRCIVWTR